MADHWAGAVLVRAPDAACQGVGRSLLSPLARVCPQDAACSPLSFRRRRNCGETREKRVPPHDGDLKMTTQLEKAEAFRKLHQNGTFVIPNPWDIGSAKMLQAWGYKALATTSAGFAFSRGRPDGDGVMSREETLADFAAIAAATDLPVSADLQGCFGKDPKVVAETIRLAGAAGLCGG